MVWKISVEFLFSFFPSTSGNTPITIWGTNLNLIQNPQIRAKYGGKEHINVSMRVRQTVQIWRTPGAVDLLKTVSCYRAVLSPMKLNGFGSIWESMPGLVGFFSFSSSPPRRLHSVLPIHCSAVHWTSRGFPQQTSAPPIPSQSITVMGVLLALLENQLLRFCLSGVVKSQAMTCWSHKPFHSAAGISCVLGTHASWVVSLLISLNPIALWSWHRT